MRIEINKSYGSLGFVGQKKPSITGITRLETQPTAIQRTPAETTSRTRNARRWFRGGGGAYGRSMAPPYPGFRSSNQ